MMENGCSMVQIVNEEINPAFLGSNVFSKTRQALPQGKMLANGDKSKENAHTTMRQSTLCNSAMFESE